MYNKFIGGEKDGYTLDGCWCEELTNNQMKIYKNLDDLISPWVRIRIWVY
jgi:hypothetical protein